MRRTRDPFATYLASFVALGVATGLMGPTLPGLRTQVGAGLRAISFVFVAQSAGYFVGALLGGRGFDRGFGHRLLAGALGGIAVSMLVVAGAGNIAVLCAAFLLLGIASALVDVGGNTLLLWARRAENTASINALHLFFGVGALLAPLLVNRSLSISGQVRLAYEIGAGVAVAAALFVLSRSAPRPVDVAEHARGEAAPPRVLFAVAVFFGLYVGTEVAFAGWIATYSDAVGIGGAGTGALLTALFWGSFTAGRLGAVALGARSRPFPLLLGSCIVSTTAAFALVAGNGAGAVVWPATVVFALGLAPQFATMLAFAGEFVPVTGLATSWFMAASAIGGIAIPWLVGQLFSAFGPGAVPAVVLAGSAVILLWVFGLGRRFAPAPASG